MMTNTDLFLDKYKQLEVAVRYAYNLDKYDSAISFLKKHKSYSKYSADIDFCSDIRNLLSHNPKVDGKYAVEPSDKVLELMDFLLQTVNNRRRCIDIAIKFKDITRSTLQGKVSDVITAMKEKHHSHIPIVGNHMVLGIFDEHALFSVVADNGIDFLSNNPDLTFNDIKKHITISDRRSKIYIFISGSMYVDELEDIFDKYYSQKKRVGLAFVTENGKEDEPLLGILTPWDVISATSKK